MNLRYRSGVLYDDYRRQYATASAGALVTASAAANSIGKWQPGYGDGRKTNDMGQIYIETLTASSDQTILFYGVDLTLSDSGEL
jgi:hypothetical protein